MPRRRQVIEPEILPASDGVDDQPVDALPTEPADERTFFDFVGGLTDAELERYEFYLYRLEPKVKNADGPKYVAKYRVRVDEDLVKTEHGGGKFQFLCKRDGREAFKKHVFEIDGAPIYQPGQTVLSPTNTPPAAVAGPAIAAPSPSNDLGQVVAALTGHMEKITAMLQNRGAADLQSEAMAASLSTMKTAMQQAVSMVAETAKTQAGSTTGNPMMDRLVEAMVTKLSGTAAAVDPKKDLLDTIALLKDLQPKPERSADLLTQLKTLKEVLGEDGVASILGVPKGGAEQTSSPRFDWRAGLITLGQQLLQQAPGMLDRLRAMRAESVAQGLEVARERARYAAQVGAVPPGGPAPAIAAPVPAQQNTPVPLITIPAPAPAQGPAPVVPFPSPAGQPSMTDIQQAGEQELDDTLKTIRMLFDAGWGGADVAEFVRDRHPDVAREFGPMMADPSQVKMFAGQHPLIAPISTDAEFDGFLQEFCETISSPRAADEGNAPA